MPDITEIGADTRVIDLAEIRAEDEFPAYAALYSKQDANPHLLSASAMRWSNDIILSRLDECRLFWLQQKKKLRCKLGELFEPLLAHHHGDDYLAVFGDHPWQCLLFLNYQLQHQRRGLFFLNSPISRNIYKNLGWNPWFEAQSQLFDHLESINAAGFRVDAMRASQGRLLRFIERIGIATPHAMSAADAHSMQRRFGLWLARIWQWTFTASSALADFPWIPLRPPEQPARRRDLEYPVNQWAYIEILLREDLAQLCRQFRQDDCEHVNRILWEITLFNYDRVEVELSFRHPYSLHRDQPEFTTALYQARYVYERVMRELKTRDRDLDLPEQMPFLRWSLVVCERIQLAPMLLDLFAFESEQVDFKRVFALQNKLPWAFESYRLETSFFPEASFADAHTGVDRTAEIDDRQWASSAVNKPLFYYRQPKPIEPPGRLQKLFLERNSNQWWLGEDALQSIRDYYMIWDPERGASWVYRSGDGAWFKQGEFF